MKPSVLFRIIFFATAAAVLPNTRAAEETSTEIKFSDATKPGTMKISLMRGDLHIRGVDAPVTTVKSNIQTPRSAPRKDGLRELAGATFNLTEKDNVITLDATEGARNSGYFNVTVPRNTSLVILSSGGGDITCLEVNGDLEIKNPNGDVELGGVAGAVLVETIQGDVSADVRELHDGKPLSFTSMTGDIVVRLPADAKANVRLRTQNGAILTDFDEKALVTKTESVGRDRNNLSSNPSGLSTRSSSSDINGEVRTTTKEVVKAGRDTAREAVSVTVAGRDVAQEAKNQSKDGLTRPLRLSLPTMTGGKIVAGTLNQGGPEIQAATMNGDVTLRKLGGQ